MSNYYDSKQKAFIELDNIIQHAIKNKKNINVKLVVLDITKRNPVSEKAVSNRINDIAEVHNLVIINNELICEVKR